MSTGITRVLAIYQSSIMQRIINTSQNPKSARLNILYVTRKIEKMASLGPEAVLSSIRLSRAKTVREIKRTLRDLIEIAADAGLKEEMAILKDLYARLTYMPKIPKPTTRRVYIKRDIIESIKGENSTLDAIWLIYRLGCRPYEIFNIKRIHKNQIYVMGKTGGRWIPVDTEEERHVAEKIRNEIRRGTIKLDQIREACRARLGIAPYNLRHLRATHMLEEGMKIEEVARKLGHRDLDTSMRYTHLLPVEFIKREYDRCFPR